MESYLSTDEQLFMIRLSWILCSCNVRFSSLNIKIQHSIVLEDMLQLLCSVLS